MLGYCIAAFIDSAHETKIKMLRFNEKMMPIINKSLAIVLHKWVTIHADMMKEEMADKFFLERSGYIIKRSVLNIL